MSRMARFSACRIFALSGTWPLPDHSSSSATTEERAICVRLSSNSPTEMPSSRATSSSLGVRLCRFSSSAMARSISRARLRTERGTQSRERSSSIIAPRMREIA